MRSYIDYDSLNEDVDKLHEFITEELEINTYREIMLLLNTAVKQINPKEKKSLGAGLGLCRLV